MGHSLTQEHKGYIRTVERLALRYFAPIWKTTPTASLEVILNQKPSHLEVVGVAIKTYMRIKDQFQNNFWDGLPLDARANSHLRKLKSITTEIKHEGQPLADFISDYIKDPFFNWNPPAHNTLVAVCNTDIDDQNKIDDLDFVDSISQIDNDITLPAEGHFEVTCNSQQQTHGNDIALVPAERHLKVQRERLQQRTDLDVVLLPAEGHFEVQNDRQQQPDSVFVKQRDEGHLHVLSNRQKTTIAHPVETFPGARL